MKKIKAQLELACSKCDKRWPDESVVEAIALHFSVEHDTDEIELSIVCICICGAQMDFVNSEIVSRRKEIDRFECGLCDTYATIHRNVTRIDQGEEADEVPLSEDEP